jgi:Ca2+-binding RTX toxin-like protein
MATQETVVMPVIQNGSPARRGPQPAPAPVPPLVNLIGTTGSDILSGDASNNTYEAGSGDDLLMASAGNDSISGDSGYDILDYSKMNADLNLARGGVLTKSGDLGTDTITGFEIEEIRANARRVNTIDGSTGTTASLDVDLSANRLTIKGLPGIGSASLKVVNFQNVNGSENADLIVGDDNANVLDGKGGNDTINGGGGDDTFMGSGGSDTYRGGSGFDTLSYEASSTGVTLVRGGTVVKADGSIDTVADFSVEAVVGARGTTNTIDGTTGTSASLAVDLSKDSLTINNLPFVGTAQLVVKNFTDVKGSENADVITGRNGANALNGAGGDDVLNGLGGADILTGGAGNDIFVIGRGNSLLNGFDRITDLVIGTDRIDGFTAQNSVRQLGGVGSLGARDIGQVLNNQAFGADRAATFTLGTGGSSRTFLALNDNRNGFQANSDAIVEITGFSGNLNNLAII